MKYDRSWDLSTIPDEVLRSEWGRRTSAKRKSHKGPDISCKCGKCRTCKMREYQKARRSRLSSDKI